MKRAFGRLLESIFYILLSTNTDTRQFTLLLKMALVTEIYREKRTKERRSEFVSLQLKTDLERWIGILKSGGKVNFYW